MLVWKVFLSFFYNTINGPRIVGSHLFLPILKKDLRLVKRLNIFRMYEKEAC